MNNAILSLEGLVFFSVWIIIFLFPRYRKQIFRNTLGMINPAELRERIIGVDFLKGISIIAVIIIHTSYLHLEQGAPVLRWDLLLNNVSRFAIPVFLFLSGLLLQAPNHWNSNTLRQFWVPKLVRIFIPYVAISICLGLLYSDTNIPLSLIQGDLSVPFYFIIILFQLYTLYPILHIMMQVYPRLFIMMSIILGMISFIVPYYYQINTIPFFLPYLFPFAYGMASKDVLYHRISFKHSIGIWIEIILIYISISTLPLFLVSPNLLSDTLFYNSHYLYGIAVAMSLILLLPQYMSGYLNRWIIWIGKNSLWIFLIHFPIMTSIYQFIRQLRMIYYFEYFSIALSTIFISSLLSFVLSHIYSIVIHQKFAQKAVLPYYSK